MEEISAIVTRSGFGFLPALAPQVSLTDIVVVGDRDAGAVAENFPERETEFEPRCGVLLVVVGLVACEEDKIRILVVDVADILRAQVAVAVGIAVQRCDGDLVFGVRVLADEPLEGCLFLV